MEYLIGEIFVRETDTAGETAREVGRDVELAREAMTKFGDWLRLELGESGSSSTGSLIPSNFVLFEKQLK